MVDIEHITRFHQVLLVHGRDGAGATRGTLYADIIQHERQPSFPGDDILYLLGQHRITQGAGMQIVIEEGEPVFPCAQVIIEGVRPQYASRQFFPNDAIVFGNYCAVYFKFDIKDAISSGSA